MIKTKYRVERKYIDKQYTALLDTVAYYVLERTMTASQQCRLEEKCSSARREHCYFTI